MIVLQPTVRLADPHLCSDSRDRLNILSALHDALVSRDVAGEFKPALVSSWRVEPDARRWTFTLRRDVSFHDGRTLIAADAAASIERACDPAVGGELGTEGVWASYLGDVRMSTPDDHTLKLETGRPMADLLELLVDIPMVPAGAPVGGGAMPPGTGPYRLLAHDGTSVELEAFDACATRRARHPRVTWREETDSARAIASVRAGSADVFTGIGAAEAAALGDGGGVRLLDRPAYLCVAFLFNARRGAGADPLVRRAINHAVNVDALIARCAHGRAERLNGPLSHRHFGCDPALAPYRHDPAAARALLERAGGPRTLTIDVPTRLPDEAPELGRLIADDLAAVGIEATLRQHEDRPAYAERVKAGDIGDLCCFDSSPASTYRVLREKLDSTVAGPWWQGYHGEAANERLAAASRTTDEVERRSTYHDAYRLLARDAPWLFLYSPANHWCTGRRARGVSIGRTGLLELAEGPP